MWCLIVFIQKGIMLIPNCQRKRIVYLFTIRVFRCFQSYWNGLKMSIQSMLKKMDMGKSCIRFKNVRTIPYDLIGELCRKISVEEYISKYEEVLK